MRHVSDQELYDHQWIVRAVLNRMRKHGQLVNTVEEEDLEQVATIALWRALTRWDPERGQQRHVYCWSVIHGALLHYQRDITRPQGWHRKHGQIARVDSLSAPDVTGGDLTLEHSLPDPIDIADRVHWRHELEAILDRIHHMEPCEQVIAGAMLNDIPVTRTKTRLGVTQPQTSKIARRVRNELSQALAA